MKKSKDFSHDMNIKKRKEVKKMVSGQVMVVGSQLLLAMIFIFGDKIAAKFGLSESSLELVKDGLFLAFGWGSIFLFLLSLCFVGE